VSEREPWVGVADVLDGLTNPDSEHEIPNHVAIDHSTSTVEKLRECEHGTAPHPAYARAHPNDPAFTIVAGKSAPPVHHDEPRRCTPRETARFQTFPDWFTFESSAKRDNYQLIGNAVPVDLATSVAEVLP